MYSRQRQSSVGGLPPLDELTKRLLIVLVSTYIAELVLLRFSVPMVEWLAWHPFRAGFAVWQPLSRFFVQGPGAFGSVLISLVVLYFFLASMRSVLTDKQLGSALTAGVVANTVVAMAADATGLLWPQLAMGWSSFVVVLPILFGLARPNESIFLFGVLPIKGVYFLWGTLLLALGGAVLTPGLGTVGGLGTWLGVVGWWHGLGPGARRRGLRKKASGIEKELRRFEVIEGGRSGNRPDDIVH